MQPPPPPTVTPSHPSLPKSSTNPATTPTPLKHTSPSRNTFKPGKPRQPTSNSTSNPNPNLVKRKGRPPSAPKASPATLNQNQNQNQNKRDELVPATPSSLMAQAPLSSALPLSLPLQQQSQLQSQLLAQNQFLLQMGLIPHQPPPLKRVKSPVLFHGPIQRTDSLISSASTISDSGPDEAHDLLSNFLFNSPSAPSITSTNTHVLQKSPPPSETLRLTGTNKSRVPSEHLVPPILPIQLPSKVVPPTISRKPSSSSLSSATSISQPSPRVHQQLQQPHPSVPLQQSTSSILKPQLQSQHQPPLTNLQQLYQQQQQSFLKQKQELATHFATITGYTDPFTEDYWSVFFGLDVWNCVSTGKQFLYYNADRNAPTAQGIGGPDAVSLPYLTKILFQGESGSTGNNVGRSTST